VQASEGSQPPTPTRQMVPAGRNASVGQAAEVPVQNSATSQGPAALRHSVVAGANGLAGQVVPTQTASSSQAVPAGLQTCPVLRGDNTQAAVLPFPTHVFTAQKELGPVGQGLFEPHTGRPPPGVAPTPTWRPTMPARARVTARLRRPRREGPELRVRAMASNW